MNSEFLGARASNAGDDYHELWAARHAIALLSSREALEALTLEGVGSDDESLSSSDAWHGVDCGLFYGGENCASADRVVLEQVKYSSAAPSKAWTLARVTAGARAEQSVIGRLARAWKGAKTLARPCTPVEVRLVTNQPIDSQLIDCVRRSANSASPTGADEQRLATSSGLRSPELQEFFSSVQLDGGAGSRFAAEEKLLGAISEWAESDILHGVWRLREFVRARMRPEHAGQVITRASVLYQFGASSPEVLFPAPPKLSHVERPIRRQATLLAMEALRSGEQFITLHGQGGIGKTTVLQEIEAELPAGSVMVVYDCYGGGTYQDPSALRHRPEDAYVQLVNQTSVTLALPLILTKAPGADLPRLFMRRLQHAATALAAHRPGALLVIAIDAADNSIIAADNRVPSERAFVLDFVRIETLPPNVRFVVSGRTGRLDRLGLPARYGTIEVVPFDREQTGEFVRRFAPDVGESWLDDFHHLSNGIPRIQSYALKGGAGDLTIALDRLRPTGKQLDDVFQSQLDVAGRKSGADTITRFCGGLLALARPVPIATLAEILGVSEAQVLDISSDLSPGLRLGNEQLNFADEDFEDFIRRHAADEMQRAAAAAADWLLARCSADSYAAMHVAEALVAAGRGAALLDLVEREAAPVAVADPVLRREAEVQRLRLAIKVCRAAADPSRALRFVLKGADGLKTEAALAELLAEHSDMAAAFASETAGRLLLARPSEIQRHGAFLFHRLAVDASKGDGIAVREGSRRLRAWLDAREVAWRSSEHKFARPWNIGVRQIASSVEAALLVRGPDAALDQLSSWSPRSVGLGVALILPSRLIAMGRSDLVRDICKSASMGPIGRLLCSVPLVLSGDVVADEALIDGLTALGTRRLFIGKFFDGHHSDGSLHARTMRIALTAAELLISRGLADAPVDRLLDAVLEPRYRRIDKRHAFEAEKLDLLLRAFTMREVRGGRIPTAKQFFEPRPIEQGVDSRTKKDHESRHDREVTDVVDGLFAFYLARAKRLVDGSNEESEQWIRNANSTGGGDDWRAPRHRESASLRAAASVSLLTLLGTGSSARELKRFADGMHGTWKDNGGTPDEDLMRTLMLRSELHAELVGDLVRAASVTGKVRISASEKCVNLAALARLLHPISPDDANAVFNQAVEGAAHIDREVMSQIQLLEKLVARGQGHFRSRAGVSRRLAAVVADAYLRLQGYDGFPWESAMRALSHLDGRRALADAARWDDEDIARLDHTLPEILKAGMDQGWLEPAHAAALACLVRDDHSILQAAVERAITGKSKDLSVLAEMAASDSLVRHQHRSDPALRRVIEQAGPRGPWCVALLDQEAFLETLTEKEPPRADSVESTGKSAAKQTRIWLQSDVIDADRLREVVSKAQAEARTAKEYTSIRELLEEARAVVSVRHRVVHLNALVPLAESEGKSEVPWALIDALREWGDLPSIAQWAQLNLPALIVKHLVTFVHMSGRRGDSLESILSMTGLPNDRLGDLVLTGIELHVNHLNATTIFVLATLASDLLSAEQAADLAVWYADRLASRVPEADQHIAPADAVYPASLEAAIAGLVFAYMGDCDVRMRWRAAHVVRRLALLGCDGALRALLPMYESRTGAAFRSEQFPFYWIAARLWYVLAWSRIASENHPVGTLAAHVLLKIALDDSFPHLLIRASARAACVALMESGWKPSIADAADALRRVNEPGVPRAMRKEARRRPRSGASISPQVKGGFSFNSVDTVPYWYEPMLRGFAAVDMQGFTSEAERWIIDVWGYPPDLNRWDHEARRHQFERFNWSLMSQGHGSLPTVERLSTHLEWHAMWCAAGELLKTQPLVRKEKDDDDWDTLTQRVNRNLLSEAPSWAADLPSPTPLVRANWLPSGERFGAWVDDVREINHRSELFPADRPDYIAVEAAVERWTSERVESIAVSSALAGQEASDALIRALQTMESAWDYKLPDEGEDAEIDVGAFRLFGWLSRRDVDGGLDRIDEFRGAALAITSMPGRAVSQACSLQRSGPNRDRWCSSANEGSPPMFVHEVWGREANDRDRSGSSPFVWGRRLLAHRAQLQQFLESSGMDLIVEVEVNRHGREYGKHIGEEEDPQEGKFDRLYRLCSDGELTIAEGNLGAWQGHRGGAAAG